MLTKDSSRGIICSIAGCSSEAALGTDPPLCPLHKADQVHKEASEEYKRRVYGVKAFSEHAQDKKLWE